jgi:hypothetical protein
MSVLTSMSRGMTGFCCAGLLCLPSTASTPLNVSDFNNWNERSFSGNTRYTIETGAGGSTLHALADGTASAFYRQGRIDLTATPCLHWRWQISHTAPESLNERNRAGDDYAARVYVVRRGGLAFWRAKTINYVWSGSQAVDSRWPNAYAGNNAQMWVVNTGNELAGQWISHARDIQTDWQTAFGETITHLDGIAVMTDGDDSGSQLSASYAKLRFTARTDSGRCSDADPVSAENNR